MKAWLEANAELLRAVTLVLQLATAVMLIVADWKLSR